MFVCVQVGPLTNENRTQCFSTHLTTFASALVSLAGPQQWNDRVFDDEINEEHSIEVTVIWLLVVSVFVLIYGNAEQP